VHCYAQEVGILKGLNYDGNIVQFYGACLREGADPMLVTEYMEGGRDMVSPCNYNYVNTFQ
jgi:serine/threonine protein kinase